MIMGNIEFLLSVVSHGNKADSRTDIGTDRDTDAHRTKPDDLFNKWLKAGEIRETVRLDECLFPGASLTRM